MDYSPESVLYLKIAYAVILLAQIAYAVWLTRRWRESGSRPADTRLDELD